jgi:uncharacterized cupin superfamily protein
MNLDHSIIRLSNTPEGFNDNVDELTADMFESSMPIQHSHDYFEDDDLGLYVGVWDTTDMIETAAPYAMDEFMVLIEGAVVIKNNTTNVCETVLAGESFIIPKGFDCQWQQTGYLRKFYVIADKQGPSAEPPGPSIDAVDAIIKFPSRTAQGNTVFYKSADNQFISGAFKGDIADSAMITSAQHRFIYLKEGSLTLVDHHLTEHRFKAGDAFIVLSGAQITGRSSDTITHHYVEFS